MSVSMHSNEEKRNRAVFLTAVRGKRTTSGLYTPIRIGRMLETQKTLFGRFFSLLPMVLARSRGRFNSQIARLCICVVTTPDIANLKRELRRGRFDVFTETQKPNLFDRPTHNSKHGAVPNKIRVQQRHETVQAKTRTCIVQGKLVRPAAILLSKPCFGEWTELLVRCLRCCCTCI